MADDYIPVNTAKQLGGRTVRAANLLRELRELIDLLSDAAGHMGTGSGGTLEANFGLNNGTGANFATLLGLVQTIFNTNTDVTGANRLSQLDEFAARLAGQ